MCIICYLPQYFFVKSFPQVQYFQPVFSTIPAVFPVKVTAKKNGKKVSKTLASNITVKNYKVRLEDATGATVSGTTIAVVGTPVQFTAKTAPAKAAVTYTSSDSAIATVDTTGKVTPVKVGKVTITAATDKASTTAEVEVKNYVLKSVAQTKANTLETVVLGKTSDIKPADIKITNTANNNAIAVKSVSVDKADATKVTVETFADMKDAAKYNVELDGTVQTFTATDGVVSDVNVTPVTIAANTKGTEIKGQTVDKNNIIIDEFKASEASGKNAELNLSTTQGYVDGDKLVLPTVGNKGTAEVKYHTYKFDTNGNEVGAYTKKVDITAVAENAITTTGFNMTFADKAPNWDKDKTTNQLAIGSSKNAYFKFVGSDGKEISNYSDYSVVSSDDSILLLPKTTLINSTTPVSVKGIKEGAAYINVLDKDGKVVKSLAVSVTASSKLTNVTLGNTAITISKTASVDNKVSVKAVDQYNNDITTASKIILSGATSDADKAISATRDGNDVKVVATDAAEAGKTYTVKVEVKNGDVTINRYFTVKVVKTNDDVTKASDLRLEVSGVKDGKVDMAVADDADAEKAAKNVTVRVAAYDAGAKIGYVDNATYEINNDKKSVVTTSTTGASISVVSCGAATVSKNLDAGKTYTVTVKTAKKTFTTTFSVVDTQASASVNITKKTTTKTNAADILAETCEVTYDGKKLNNPTFVVNGNDCKTVGASTYIAKASVYVTNSKNITYTVPVTINTTFTR
ncbi:Bacterial Ig-like domain (group 2) [Roseburia faecis]|uniref:Bacterial Ig-like domain (Group 2) n=2 Tax=Clostridia TaxID=186801 RepID=A0A173UXS2_9FIRM|nr:Bacterial Ig-like domain (group 2) [Roseburia faecis]